MRSYEYHDVCLRVSVRAPLDYTPVSRVLCTWAGSKARRIQGLSSKLSSSLHVLELWRKSDSNTIREACSAVCAVTRDILRTLAGKKISKLYILYIGAKC